MMDVTLSGNLKSYISECSDINENYFGMDYFNINTNITRSVYDMPPHDWIRVRMHFAAYDEWNNFRLMLLRDKSSNYNQTFLVQE